MHKHTLWMTILLLALGCGGDDSSDTAEPEPQPSTIAQKALGALDRGAIERTRQDMVAIRTAVVAFQAQGGEIADSDFQALSGKLAPTHIRRLPMADAWGSGFVFQYADTGWTLTAPGENGQIGGGDDIVLAEHGFTTVPDNYKLN